MFSLEPRFSICELPIFVIIAISGIAALVMRPISPAWLMPISRTQTCVVWGIERIESGIPISLLKLPSDLCVWYFEPQTALTNSFVVVFPTLPVTAMTFGAMRVL